MRRGPLEHVRSLTDTGFCPTCGLIPMLTVGDIAKHLQKDVRWVRDCIEGQRHPHLPAVDVGVRSKGGQYRVPVSDYCEWLRTLHARVSAGRPPDFGASPQLRRLQEKIAANGDNAANQNRTAL